MNKPPLLLIKIGGNIIDHPAALNDFLHNFSRIELPKILVHGGGKIASEISRQMGHVPNMVNGRRVTDAATLKIVTMVYGGLINKQIAATLESMHCKAVGITGADGNTLLAHKRIHQDVDFGFVGDIDAVDTHLLKTLLASAMTPIVAPLSHDGKGCLLNTNADTVAAQLAIALSSDFDVQFFYCFEKKGLLKDPRDDNSVISDISVNEIQTLKDNGTITDGMIPKVDNIGDAISKGVSQVILCHAEDIADILSGNKRFGTIFTR